MISWYFLKIDHLFSDWPFKGDRYPWGAIPIPYPGRHLWTFREPVNERVLKAAAISHYLPLKTGRSPGCCLPPIDPENLQQWLRRRSWMILPARPMANTIGGVVYSWYCGVGWRINYWPILHMLSKYCGEEQRWRPPTTVRNQKSGPAPCTNHLRGGSVPILGGLTTYLMGESLPK